MDADHDGQARDDLKRRAYLIGLAIGVPTVPLIWLVRGPGDPFILTTYPLLTRFLVVVAGLLATRRWPVARVERVVILVVAAFFLLRLGYSVHLVEDLESVRRELTESTFWNINLTFVIAYLAFDTRRGLRVSLLIYAVFWAIVASRLVPEILSGGSVGTALTFLRVGAFLGAMIALLYVLASVKEQLARTRVAVRTAEHLAHTDPLTGTANRRRVEAVLDERVVEADRHDQALSVILIDLDGFKQVNDRWGHEAGDVVLRAVVERLLPQLRGSDLLGRWGGDELMIIAPHADERAAEELAERCRRVLVDEPFGQVGTVGASFGVAQYAPGDCARDLVRRADRSLYRAKGGPRQRLGPGSVRDHASGQGTMS